MSHVSLRVTESEKLWMENYAKLHGVSLSDAVKDAFFEKLEDEYDLKAIQAWESGGSKKMYSHAEIGKLLGFQ